MAGAIHGLGTWPGADSARSSSTDDVADGRAGNRRWLAFLVRALVCGSVATQACTSEEGAPDAVVADGPVLSDTDAATECNGLTNSGPLVVANQVAEDAPAPLGGTIVDGTYYLTASIVYTGPGGATGPIGSGGAETHVYRSGELRLVVTDGEGTRSAMLLYLTNGNEITFVFECPDLAPPPFEAYTATAQAVTLYRRAGSLDIGVTYGLIEPL